MKFNKIILILFFYLQVHAVTVNVNFRNLMLDDYIKMYAKIMNLNILMPLSIKKSKPIHYYPYATLDEDDLKLLTVSFLEQNKFMLIKTDYGYKVVSYYYKMIGKRQQEFLGYTNKDEMIISFSNIKLYGAIKMIEKYLKISIIIEKNVENSSINYSSNKPISKNELLFLFQDILEYEGKILIKENNNTYKIIDNNQ